MAEIGTNAAFCITMPCARLFCFDANQDLKRAASADVPRAPGSDAPPVCPDRHRF
jgi:hypothetical protein